MIILVSLWRDVICKTNIKKVSSFLMHTSISPCKHPIIQSVLYTFHPFLYLPIHISIHICIHLYIHPHPTFTRRRRRSMWEDEHPIYLVIHSAITTPTSHSSIIPAIHTSIHPAIHPYIYSSSHISILLATMFIEV